LVAGALVLWTGEGHRPSAIAFIFAGVFGALVRAKDELALMAEAASSLSVTILSRIWR
jgi:hypothetical protein